MRPLVSMRVALSDAALLGGVLAGDTRIPTSTKARISKSSPVVGRVFAATGIVLR